MSDRLCGCCQHLLVRSGKLDSFYNEHFIPRGWRLSYTKLSSGVSLYLTGYCRDCGGDLEERVLLTNGLSSDKLLKAERTRNMRYKRPALASIGVEDLIRELEEIQEACTDIHWFTDQDDESLLNALDGDEEDAYEFRIAFADLEAKANHLSDLFYELENHDDPAWQVYNDCTVALIGNRYQVAGFDMDEEDYFSLTSYEQNLACTEAGKRVMRMTKPAMLSTIGQCVCILVSFLDLRQSYDYLKATFDILRDTNTSLLDTIKEISTAYEAAEANHFYHWYEETAHFDRLLSCLPQRAWIE